MTKSAYVLICGSYMGIGAFFRSVYYSDKALTENDFGRSRTLSIFEGCSARTITNLTSSAFLAGFASYLGAGDSFNGIIGAIPLLAGIIQLISPIVFERMEKRKLLIIVSCLVYRLMLGSMVLIPFIFTVQTIRLAMLAIIYLLSNMALSFITPAASSWLIDLTPENIRGRYFGIRESYVLTAATFFTLIMGRVLDICKKSGHEYNGFIIMFSFIGFLAIVNFITFSSMKEPPVKRNKSSLNLKKVVTIPLKNKKFTSIIFLFVLWNIGAQVAVPFFAVYMVTGLKLHYTFIMAASTAGTLTNVLTVRIWGRIADKKSWIFVTKFSILIIALTHMTWFFINSQTAMFLVPLMHITGGLGWAGIGIATFNIQFTYSPEVGKTIYVGFNAALCGIVGFLSTLAGSFILTVLKGFSFKISGFPIGNMQLVFALSGVLLVVCVAYIHIFVNQHVE